MKQYSLYTDGACSGNPGRGGWSAVAFDEKGNRVMMQSGGFRLTTNNRMEILAVSEGLNYLVNQICGQGSKDTDIKVTVYSDSQLVIGTMNLGWAKKTNTDLWSHLDTVCKFIRTIKGWKFAVEFVKVKGHADNPKNNLADCVAVAASQPVNATQVDYYYESIAQEAKLLEDGQKHEIPIIEEITLLGCQTRDKREVRVKLNNGTVVSILPLSGGFQQVNCTQEESQVTLAIAWKYNKWLNGKAL